MNFSTAHLQDEEIHLTHLLYEVLKSYDVPTGLAAMMKLVLISFYNNNQSKDNFMHLMESCWDATISANNEAA